VAATILQVSQKELACVEQRDVRIRAIEHPIGDDTVCLFRHVNLVPVGEPGWVAANLRVPVARKAGAVGPVATTARHERAVDAIPVGILDELHEGVVVVCVDDLHAGVPGLEPADLLLQQLVVPPRERVEPREAAELVVVRRCIAFVSTKVGRHAPDGEVPRDKDRLGAEVDHLLHAGSDAVDNIGHILEGRVSVLAELRVKEPKVVVIAPNLTKDDQGLAQEPLCCS
jgi:hypothetical protein